LISKWDSHDTLTRVSDYRLMPGRVLATVQSETFIKPSCSAAHCTRVSVAIAWHSFLESFWERVRSVLWAHWA